MLIDNNRFTFWQPQAKNTATRPCLQKANYKQLKHKRSCKDLYLGRIISLLKIHFSAVYLRTNDQRATLSCNPFYMS